MQSLETNRHAPSWQLYLEYVDRLVLEALSESVSLVLQLLLRHMQGASQAPSSVPASASTAANDGAMLAAAQRTSPLLAVHLVLENMRVEFQPAIELAQLSSDAINPGGSARVLHASPDSALYLNLLHFVRDYWVLGARLAACGYF